MLCPCIVESLLPVTSAVNKAVVAGDLDTAGVRVGSGSGAVPMSPVPPFPGAQTTEEHAAQAWDRIARGEFYLITDTSSPWVRGERLRFPLLDGDVLLDERWRGMRARQLDNRQAFSDQRFERSALAQGPGHKEQRRCMQQVEGSKL